MKLADHLALLGGYQDHFEYYQGLEVAPTNKPPSLKAKRRDPHPVPDAQTGWKVGDSLADKRRARSDLKIILDRIKRQSGKPVLVRGTPLNMQDVHMPHPFH